MTELFDDIVVMLGQVLMFWFSREPYFTMAFLLATPLLVWAVVLKLREKREGKQL